MNTDSAEKVYVYPNSPAPHRPVIFNPMICKRASHL
jgi:hypothetical protein